MNKTTDKDINDYKIEIDRRVETYNRPLREFENRILEIKKRRACEKRTYS